MDIAVAHMAEGADACAGNGLGDQRIRFRHEGRNARYRDRNVMLDRAAFGLLCRRHAFAHVPEGSALRFVLGNDGVLDETVGDDRFEKVLHHPLRAFGGIRGGDIDQRVPRMRRFHRISNAGDVPGGELDAEPRHQFEARQGRPAEARCPIEKRQCVLDASEAGKSHLVAPRFREELQNGAGYDAERSLGTDEKIAQIVARIVLLEASEPVPDLPGRKHDLQPQAKLAHIAIDKHGSAAGIGRKIAADPGGAFRAE